MTATFSKKCIVFLTIVILGVADMLNAQMIPIYDSEEKALKHFLKFPLISISDNNVTINVHNDILAFSSEEAEKLLVDDNRTYTILKEENNHYLLKTALSTLNTIFSYGAQTAREALRRAEAVALSAPGRALLYARATLLSFINSSVQYTYLRCIDKECSKFILYNIPAITDEDAKEKFEIIKSHNQNIDFRLVYLPTQVVVSFVGGKEPYGAIYAVENSKVVISNRLEPFPKEKQFLQDFLLNLLFFKASSLNDSVPSKLDAYSKYVNQEVSAKIQKFLNKLYSSERKLSNNKVSASKSVMHRFVLEIHQDTKSPTADLYLYYTTCSLTERKCERGKKKLTTLADPTNDWKKILKYYALYFRQIEKHHFIHIQRPLLAIPRELSNYRLWK